MTTEQGRVVAATWSAEQLQHFTDAAELRIATERADGSHRPPLPIWVVCVDGQVYVRTWYRRDSGWFGQVLERPRARIAIPSLQADVTVDDVGDDRDAAVVLRERINAAYRAKYGRGAATRMVSKDAAATTLRLVLCQP